MTDVSTTARRTAPWLPVLFQDACLVAIDKPPGMLVHRSRIDKHERTFVLQTLRNQIGCHVFPIHRLDRPTSGVLLFALSAELAAQICEQFSTRSVTKEYSAIVRGHAPTSGCHDEPLLEKLDRKSDKRARQDKESQSAVTGFETLRRWTVPFSAGKYRASRYSLVRIVPRTGRKHQIRRHFNHMSHPVIGDSTYGDRRHNRLFRERFGIQRLLLAATSLYLKHPLSGKPLVIHASRGTEFDQAIAALEKNNIEQGNIEEDISGIDTSGI